MLSDRRHPCFRNFDSVVSIDVIRMKSYLDSLFDPTIFLQSYMIMPPSGRLWETENKRISQIPGLKSGRGRLRNISSGRLRESL